jgi:hypothetical protein
MKYFTLLFCLCLAFACKKDCATPIYPISGLWEGTYTVEGTPGSFYYSLIVKPDGRLITEGTGADGVSYLGVGTWTLTGNEFNYTTKPLHVNFQQKGTLVFSNDGKLTSGTWQDLVSPSMLRGTFPVMKRVN